ncbi:MAG: hypothetical protein ACKVG9_14595, partial [Rhodospirillales bacterium]
MAKAASVVVKSKTTKKRKAANGGSGTLISTPEPKDTPILEAATDEPKSEEISEESAETKSETVVETVTNRKLRWAEMLLSIS